MFKHQPWRENLVDVSISYHLLAMGAATNFRECFLWRASLSRHGPGDWLGSSLLIHTWRSQDLVCQNMTSFEDSLGVNIKLKWGHGSGPNPVGLVPLPEEQAGHKTHTELEDLKRNKKMSRYRLGAFWNLRPSKGTHWSKTLTSNTRIYLFTTTLSEVLSILQAPLIVTKEGKLV